MSFAVRLLRSAVAALLTVPVLASAQVKVLAHPQARVLNKVDSAVRTTLRGNVPEAVAHGAIGSRLNASKQLDHVMLMLQPTGEQEAALHTLLDAQQDKNSPYFHKWLTPEAFAQSFGVADADIARVTAWLQDSGLTVESVSHSKRIIQFAGPVSNVESAFATEMHNVTVAGEAHISNTTEISVPAALASVVKGIARLNDIFPKTDAHVVGTVAERKAVAAAQGESTSPNYGTAAGTHYVSPGDVATIFNAKPLLNASNPIDGTGVTIAVLARSNIDLGDVAAFRSMFGLPAKNPTITLVGSDPGKNGDDTEAYLDAEWAGAVAPNANINFIVNTASLVSGGTDGAALYAVDNNIGDIISLSYGACEKNFGASGTAFWNILWQQAAAQGQTVFVSSGDSGAAGCDSSSATYATGGYGVNALGVSAYNVSVGGSMFVDYGSSQYWGATGGTTIPFANALSYIPEAALNQGRLTSTLLNSASTATTTGSGIFSGGGGISIFTARPSWQTGSGISSTADPTDYTGAVVPLTGTTVNGPHRLSPDLSLISAYGHDGTLFCAGAICQTTATGMLGNAGIVGGTSVATPVMASAQALINQKNGGRQGNANIYYYKLADNQYRASTTACQATNGTAANPTVTLPAATCNFQDITAGSIVVPTASTGSAGIGFNAGVGYDAATGLGSVNIANVANNWSSITFNATGTTLSLTPTTGTHGASQTATITVNPASGSGTPTGDVSIIATNAATAGGYGAPQVFTLSGGTVNGIVNSLPGGTYSVYAHYAGDGTFASSDSAPVTVTIGKEDSTTSIYNYSISTAGGLANTSSFTYGSSTIYLDTEVVGASGNGTASGSVTFALSQNGTPLPSLTTSLDTYGTTYLQSGPGLASYYLLPNYATLTPGSYSLTASYAGDNSFNASTGTSTFTVAKATPTATLRASTAQIKSGQVATLYVALAAPTSAAAAATGTVNFVDTTTGNSLGSVPLGANGAATFTTAAIISSGAHTITATYSGDGNYNTNTATATVTVNTGSAPTVTVTSSGTLTVGATVTLIATLSATPASSSTVSFFDSGVLLGTTTTTTTTAIRAVTNFTAGAHSITAVFGGNSTQSSSTSPVANVSIAKNTTALNITAGPVTQNYGNVALSASITRSPSSTAAPVVGLTGTVSFYDTSVSPSVLLGTATPAFDPAGYSTYAAAIVNGTLAPGNHTITAIYSGDANYNGSTAANTPTLTVAKGVPVLTVNSTTVEAGTANTTFTTSIAFGGVKPTGTVIFSVDNGNIVTATCTGSASPLVCTASYPTASLPSGLHTINAYINADSFYNAVLAKGSLTVNGGTRSVLTSPTPGSTLPGTTVTFNWTVGVGVAHNRVYVGSYPGGIDYYSGNPVYGTTSQTIGGLPTDGSTVYVRLFSFINGAYQYDDYTYTAATQAPVKSALTSPAPGSTLPGTTVTFNWTAGNRVTNNQIYVGSYQGGIDYYSGNPLYGTTSQTISGLPNDGSTVYVRLFSYINGSYQYTDYTFTAYSAAPVKSAITSPASGSTLPGSTVTFNWTPGTRVTNNQIYVGSYQGGIDYYSGNPLYGTTSQTISGLPTNGSTVYVRLFSYINGAYQYTDYTYTAASPQ